VDAVVFNSDPLHGGKFVVQAKRYSNTVDVAAVRELYGTVLNEGANRGILVTTSHFGRDAHEWAANKPLTLIDGPNILALLTKHATISKSNPVQDRRSPTRPYSYWPPGLNG
jgi:restriction system protein